MAKRKFKRDYIMLEAKDLNFRFKDKVSPKAFAKIEVTDEKSVIALYAENLKNIDKGYSVVAIRSDYETIDLGDFNVNSQGKGEFSFDMGDDEIDIKGIAITQDRAVPLIGFKGSKIDNYEDILFPPQYEFEEVEDEGDDINDNDYEEYEEIEYIEMDEDDEYEEENREVEDDEDDNNYNDYEEYEEIEYIEPNEDNEYEYEEVIYEEIEDDEDEDNREYEEKVVTPQKKNSKSRNDEYIEKKINKAKSVLEKQYTKNTYTSV